MPMTKIQTIETVLKLLIGHNKGLNIEKEFAYFERKKITNTLNFSENFILVKLIIETNIFKSDVILHKLLCPYYRKLYK